jgi:preprotein translocase subunit YajC
MFSLLAASDTNNSGGGWSSLIIFLLIPVAMYFLLIRPQRKRQRETAALQQSIEIGDEVMTTSGMYGFITGFEGDVAWLEIDDDVQIRVARAAIQRKVDTSNTASGTDTKPASKSDGGSEVPKD